MYSASAKYVAPGFSDVLQVVNVNQNSVRRYVMTVAAVIVRC